MFFIPFHIVDVIRSFICVYVNFEYFLSPVFFFFFLQKPPQFLQSTSNVDVNTLKLNLGVSSLPSYLLFIQFTRIHIQPRMLP